MSSSRTLICGVDPGLTGAITFYDPDTNQLDVFDMPVVESRRGKKRRELDLPKLGMIIDGYAPQTKIAIIEEVGARPGAGVTGMFRFGYMAGAVAGALSACAVPIFFALPAVWKMAMGLTRDKKLSLELARKLWPNEKHIFLRAMDDGRAESALLAKFGADKILPAMRGRM